MENLPRPLGFVGFGNMGRAIAEGLLRSGRYSKEDFLVAVKSEESEKRLRKEGWSVLSADSVATASEVIFLAVKPKDVERVAKEISPWTAGKVVVSVVAGLSSERLRNFFPNAYAVRTMPNLAVSVGAGVWGVVLPSDLPPDRREGVLNLLRLTGEVVEVDDSLMNAVTALAGSGPAFVSELLDAFALAGVKMGLRYSDALRVAMQTFAGAVELLRERGWHPAVMRDAVASPSGTTIYGLSVMEERGVKGSLIKTLEEAKKRADELS